MLAIGNSNLMLYYENQLQITQRLHSNELEQSPWRHHNRLDWQLLSNLSLMEIINILSHIDKVIQWNWFRAASTLTPATPVAEVGIGDPLGAPLTFIEFRGGGLADWGRHFIKSKTRLITSPEWSLWSNRPSLGFYCYCCCCCVCLFARLKKIKRITL